MSFEYDLEKAYDPDSDDDDNDDEKNNQTDDWEIVCEFEFDHTPDWEFIDDSYLEREMDLTWEP